MLPDVPCHITQRGVDRCETFSSDQERTTYLCLVRENLEDAAVRILGYCLMSNHVHVVAIPAREDSLSILFRRVHGRYAQYYNAHSGRSGRLWQNRFFPACWQNRISGQLWPTWKEIRSESAMLENAGDHEWSSAAAHLTGSDNSGLLDMQWWQEHRPNNWGERLRDQDSAAEIAYGRAPMPGGHLGKRVSLKRWRRCLVGSGAVVVLRRR